MIIEASAKFIWKMGIVMGPTNNFGIPVVCE